VEIQKLNNTEKARWILNRIVVMLKPLAMT